MVGVEMRVASEPARGLRGVDAFRTPISDEDVPSSETYRGSWVAPGGMAPHRSPGAPRGGQAGRGTVSRRGTKCASYASLTSGIHIALRACASLKPWSLGRRLSPMGFTCAAPVPLPSSANALSAFVFCCDERDNHDLTHAHRRPAGQPAKSLRSGPIEPPRRERAQSGVLQSGPARWQRTGLLYGARTASRCRSLRSGSPAGARRHLRSRLPQIPLRRIGLGVTVLTHLLRPDSAIVQATRSSRPDVPGSMRIVRRRTDATPLGRSRVRR